MLILSIIVLNCFTQNVIAQSDSWMLSILALALTVIVSKDKTVGSKDKVHNHKAESIPW